MNENQTNPTAHKYTPGDRVRILKPAQGVPETARFIGTLGTVKEVESGDLFVEPDAAPNYANSWWYGGDEIEFVAASGGLVSRLRLVRRRLRVPGAVPRLGGRRARSS